MTAKHTPGPWSATHSIPQEGFDCWWITANPGHNLEKELATVAGGASTSEANARLIAAAPRLLNACREALAFMEDEKIAGSLPDELRAAIGQATGVAGHPGFLAQEVGE